MMGLALVNWQEQEDKVTHIMDNTSTIESEQRSISVANFSASSSFLCLLFSGFVKLAFAAVLAAIEAVLSVLNAYLRILYAFQLVTLVYCRPYHNTLNTQTHQSKQD